MTIERIDDQIVIKLPSTVDLEGVGKLVDYLLRKESATGSPAAQEQLDAIPGDHLQRVDAYLKDILIKIEDKANNRLSIMALAGAWADMPDDDFEELQEAIRGEKDTMFNREVKL